MSPFTPRGDSARWRIIYNLLKPLDIGDVLTYEEMGKALDLDPRRERVTIQLAMRRAAQELEEVEKRAVDVVTNEGYRVVEPKEHLMLARRHQKRANRQLSRGQSKVINVDFNLIDPETRKAFEVIAGAFAAQIDFNQRMDIRQANLEAAVRAVTQQTEQHLERTADEIEELRARLRRLEEGRKASESE
jgi:hypothetical protein